MKTRMSPVVGISANISLADDEKRSFSKGTELHYLQEHYIRFVEAGDGIPLLLPPLEDLDMIPALIQRLGGLIVSGGVDVDPSLYGEANTHSKGCDLRRDRFETALIREARRQDRAILCICRGIQVLNIALGGNLYQDIPTQIKGALRHHRWEDGKETLHQTRLTRKSVLTELFGQEEINTNSSHHQSVREVGEGLVVLAEAADGVVEAVECPEDRCTIGVQWHPERMLKDPKQVELARWFVNQAKCEKAKKRLK